MLACKFVGKLYEGCCNVETAVMGTVLSEKKVTALYISFSVCAELGKVEDEIFKNRRDKDLEFRRRNKEKRRRTNVHNIVLESASTYIVLAEDPREVFVCLFHPCRAIIPAILQEDNLLQGSVSCIYSLLYVLPQMLFKLM